MTLRRGALWALLAAKLVGGWGVGWDIRWHLLIGRDSFWIAPHVMAYAAVAATAMISLGVLALETWRTRRRAPPPDAVTVVGLAGTRGFHLAWWGVAIAILAAPIDDLWHRLFGIDVTLWSLPHLLALAGSQVSNLGIVLIALEVYDEGALRWTALAAGGVLLLGTFYIIVDPSIQTAFHRAAVVFGLSLAAVSGAALARLPALSHALPSIGDAALALALTLVASLMGTACASSVAELMERYTRVGRQAANRSSSAAGVSANIS